MKKIVLITGATSGFGAAAARRFVREGWRVVATGRRAERLDSLCDELGTKDAFGCAFDMRDADKDGFLSKKELMPAPPAPAKKK